MSVQSIDSLLESHPFFAGLDEGYRKLIAGCASNVRFNAGEQIFRAGEEANGFFLLRYGRVAIEVFAPGRGPITIQSLHEGEILGWSWILPPYRRHADARAIDLTRAIAFDGACMRGKFEDDPRLGYEMLKRFTPIIVRRLHETQLQLLDVYGNAVEV